MWNSFISFSKYQIFRIAITKIKAIAAICGPIHIIEAVQRVPIGTINGNKQIFERERRV